MDNLTNEQRKQILNDICDEECKEHNLDVKIDIVTIEEYESGILKKPVKLQQVTETAELLSLPFWAAGAHFNSKKKNRIVIFIKEKTKSKKMQKTLVQNIWTCYHELRHEQQATTKDKMKDFSYESFMMQISHVCHRIQPGDYRLEHDKYYFEIDADLYAHQKTKEYLMKNYPEVYEQQKEYLDFLYQKTKFYQMTFDPSFELERALQEMKKYSANKKKELVNKKTITNNRKVAYKLDSVSPILSIFIDKITDEKIKYKPMKHIMRNPNFKKLDKRIIYAFFSSKTFLEQLDYNRLTYEELQILKESLEYTMNKYQEQIEIMSQEKEMTLDYYLKESKSILTKMRITSNYYEKHLRRQLNPFRNQFDMLEHERNLPNVLTTVNEQIERKSTRRGYITINTFYIVGLLLSISTIIYLLLK